MAAPWSYFDQAPGNILILFCGVIYCKLNIKWWGQNMILTNLHMVDIPYARKVSCARESKVIEVVVNDTQSDSIQYLNFAKKWFIQYSIQYCFTQDSIQNIIQFKINSGDSIQNIIQFNSQGMINTGRIGKVPKNWPKSVQNRQKRGLIIKNGKYRFKNWVIHSFHDKIQFKGLFNIIFSGIFNSKNYSIIFFPRKFNSKIYSKFLIWLDSIQ